MADIAVKQLKPYLYLLDDNNEATGYLLVGEVMPPFEDIHEGDVIDLGNRTLEVYDLPGHTPGGILLLFKEDRILLVKGLVMGLVCFLIVLLP